MNLLADSSNESYFLSARILNRHKKRNWSAENHRLIFMRQHRRFGVGVSCFIFERRIISQYVGTMKSLRNLFQNWWKMFDWPFTMLFIFNKTMSQATTCKRNFQAIIIFKVELVPMDLQDSSFNPRMFQFWIFSEGVSCKIKSINYNIIL